ncbi:MAG: hypothetical protein ACKOGP_09035, partial [Bacteroidota bacterium]
SLSAKVAVPLVQVRLSTSSSNQSLRQTTADTLEEPLGGRLRFASEDAPSSLPECDPEPFKAGHKSSWFGLIRV